MNICYVRFRGYLSKVSVDSHAHAFIPKSVGGRHATGTPARYWEGAVMPIMSANVI